MKKVILLLTTVLFLSVTRAQAPQALNYQGVARTALGLIIPDQAVGVRFSILEGSATGTVLYQETATTNTNNFGLFTLAVGNGIPVAGTFAAINWANGLLKYLKVEIAPQGGSTYSIQGTTVLLSVPYSLYSEKTRLFAGNGISITNGNTISGNYVAGSGITITGNVIAATAASNQWLTDANGIYYQNTLGGIGVGGNTDFNSALTVTQKATGGQSAAAAFKGNDTYQTVIRFVNGSTTPEREYQFNLAGISQTAFPTGSFALYHATANRFIWNTDGTNNGFLGIGSYSGVASTPKSRLHVFAGDVNIDQIGSGIIMKSPNGQCWKVTIDNTGNFVRTAITCL
jgi:hypothetical protein